VTLPAVLTIEEAAAELRIGRTAAYQAARRGELPVIKIGRTLRVPRHRLDALLGRETSESPVGEPDSRDRSGVEVAGNAYPTG
jgi:excisionase family DNA binding protein